ncbi:uncharacterized protein YqhQ [Clostridium acetobutylicum]|nr:uncharacterized protein YqhQ [Clostridium acetobutylicum]
MSKKGTVGGQAVIEGVMMRGAKGIATAVRTLDGSIKVEFKDVIPYTKRNKFFWVADSKGICIAY